MQELCQTILPGTMDMRYKFPETLFGDDTAFVHNRTIHARIHTSANILISNTSACPSHVQEKWMSYRNIKTEVIIIKDYFEFDAFRSIQVMLP